MSTVENQLRTLVDEVKSLAKAINKLAVVDERTIDLKKDFDGLGARVTKMEHTLNDLRVQMEKTFSELKLKAALNAQTGNMTYRWLERLLAFLVIAALTANQLFK